MMAEPEDEKHPLLREEPSFLTSLGEQLSPSKAVISVSNGEGF